MEFLLDKLKSPEELSTDNEAVMSRLDWLNHLCLIYNLTLGIPSIFPVSAPIKTEAFLNTLIENFTRLPLKSLTEYNKQTSIKCLTFKEIFVIFEHDFGKTLTWDQIMEKIIYFEVPVKGHKRGGSESPGSLDLNELVFISKKISSSSVDYDNEPEHRSQRLGDLRIPHTPPAFESFSYMSGEFTPSPRGSQDFMGFARASLRVPEFGDISLPSKNESKLNLSCKKISILSQKLPTCLIELNLSHNQIERMPNLEDLEKLEYLNLSWNFLATLSGARKTKSLKELFLAHNRLGEFENLFCENLVILDISYNKVQTVNAVSLLAAAKGLKAIDVDGNALTQVVGYKEKIKMMLPQVVAFGAQGIAEFTRFPRNFGKGKKKGLKKAEGSKSKCKGISK